VLVGKDRYSNGWQAIRQFGSDVLVLDDGFQHKKLHRDIDLVLVDAKHPVGNGFLIPRGILREPIKHIARADALVVTRCKLKEPFSLPQGLENHWKNRPAFFCRHEPDGLIAHKKRKTDRLLTQLETSNGKAIKGKRILAFSGIGNNDDFLATVKGFGCEVLDFLKFSDHHAYNKKDIETIQKTAEVFKADCILTTEKDYVRVMLEPWRVDMYAVGIKMVFSDKGKAFDKYITKRSAK
jgi:tetraacyldisaccharide 4'-kinase